MACGEPSPSYMKQMELIICQLCGRPMNSCNNEEHAINYQKQVDPPANLYGDNVEATIPPDPVPHPKEFYTASEIPLITHTSTIEYRVTGEVRGKPADQTGVTYIMNHGAMDRADVEEWIAKKKRMKEMNLSWVGDGNYFETRSNMLHFFGNTTHLFLKNPDKPYGNSPPLPPGYTQIFPDSRYEEIEETLKRKKCKNSFPKKAVPLQVCIPIPVVPGKTVNSQGGTTQTPTREKAEEPIETKEQTKTGGTGISTAMKASCLPVGGGSCPPPVKMMLCLPCPPPESITGSSPGVQSSTPCQKKKPTDYTYRCESRELRGGNLYQCCQCNKRNGLQHDCPRTPCQGRPACLTKPWPDCWPSGGCHGIDFTREKGLKRVDPCHAQRFDKKECKPPGVGSKADCGGNMMVVVCPPPTSNC